MDEKKYKGYGYHGGGRPPKPVELKAVTLTISLLPADVKRIRAAAASLDCNVSQYVMHAVRREPAFRAISAKEGGLNIDD